MRGEGIEVTPGVQELRQAQREQVVRAVEELIAWVVESAGSASSVVHRFDRELHPRLMALGLALVGLWLVHRVPEEVPPTLRTGRGGTGSWVFAGRRFERSMASGGGCGRS